MIPVTSLDRGVTYCEVVKDADFEAAGLFDAVEHADTGRLELLRWLAERGFSLDQMLQADARESLGALAGDTRLLPGDRLSDAESRIRSGLEEDDFIAVATAFGFSPLPDAPDELGLTEAEVTTIAQFGGLAAMFSEDEGLGFLRVVGNSITRIAEAAVSMFLTDVESPHLTDGGNELVLAQKVLAAIELLDEFIPLLDPVLRRQVLQSIERGRVTMISYTERLQYRYAVGFVDLVGFTPLSEAMPAAELGSFIRRFEGRAHDAATAAGARLVKLIGDEVMFVAPDPDSACRVAEQLMSSLWTDAATEVEPRGGLAYGDVLVRGGDYYGQIVNLASRLADDAQPRELLVSEAFADAATTRSFEAAGRRALKGFSELVDVRSTRFG